MTAAPGPVCYGDHDVAVGNEILRTVVGSGLHGIAIEGTDDHDEMGVFIEPPQYVLGVHQAPPDMAPQDASRLGPYDDHTCRTQPDGARSGPGDVDLTIYSLRKYLRLATQGNPTVLLPLFAPEDDLLVSTGLGYELRDLAPRIVSRGAGKRFLGYLDAQRRAMLGERNNRANMPNRPELVEKYGFDVKYASHALRLAMQGVELMQTGRLTLPMPENDRALVRAVKQGEYDFQFVLDKISSYERLLITLVHDRRTLSPLPETPDFEAVTLWSISAHQRAWAH